MTPRGRRGLLCGSLACSLALLVWTVLWKLEAPYLGDGGLRVIKLMPFGADNATTASFPLEVAANLVLFVPLGLHLGLLAPRTWPRPRLWWGVTAASAAVSVLLETAQYALAVGVSDLTDVLVNTAGGTAGFGILELARRGLGPRAEPVMTRVCTAGTALALLAAIAVFASPLHFRQRDVVCTVPGDPASCARIPSGDQTPSRR